MKRYEDECKMLAYLANKQLNLEKNKVKDNFENYSFLEILVGVRGELHELEMEIEDFIRFHLNTDRILEELGDVAAYLVGLLAKLNKEIK